MIIFDNLEHVADVLCFGRKEKVLKKPENFHIFKATFFCTLYFSGYFWVPLKYANNGLKQGRPHPLRMFWQQCQIFTLLLFMDQEVVFTSLTRVE